MGIYFPGHYGTGPNWMGWQYETGQGEDADSGTKLEEELRTGAIRFNDLMKDGVTAQLNTIMAKGNREFTNEMLGYPGGRGKRILDVKG